MSGLVEIKYDTPIATTQSPDNLLAMAIEKGADIDQLTKLMDLKERYDSANAKRSFYEAMADFQSKVPSIRKTSNVSYKNTNYNFAPLGSIAEQIRQSMRECGLSYRFEQSHLDGIEITCIVTHLEGHSEQASMKASADTTGSKNSIQAIGSTVSYLQRYTLISVLGLTTADEDIDAQTPEEISINDEIKQIIKAESLEELIKIWTVLNENFKGMKELHALAKAKDKRKNQLMELGQ